MKDDKGLFQGGKYGRTFGRVKDKFGMEPKQAVLTEDPNKVPYSEPSTPEQDLANKRAGIDRDLAPAGNRVDFAVRNVNPDDPQSVADLQEVLNATILKDSDKKLTVDGQFGPKTLEATRNAQQARDDVQRYRTLEDKANDAKFIGPQEPNLYDMPMHSQARQDEYDRRGWKYDDTIDMQARGDQNYDSAMTKAQAMQDAGMKLPPGGLRGQDMPAKSLGQMAHGSQERRDEYDRRGWAYDDTTVKPSENKEKFWGVSRDHRNMPQY